MSTTNLLEKFDIVMISNEQRISEEDNNYCIEEGRKYKEAIEVYKDVLQQFETIYNKYPRNINSYRKTGYIDNNYDINHTKNRMQTIKDEFINGICYYFSKKYKITIERDFKDKYDLDITYQDILNEIFVQLEGFNFNEKAVKELRDDFIKELGGRRNIEIKNNKISISNYIYFDSWSWSGTKISYRNDRVIALFKVLSHFEREENDIIITFNNVINELQEGTKTYDIFRKYSFEHLDKVKNFKIYKNNKVDIIFTTKQLAEEFLNEYCGRLN